jgi:uncharacterized phage protein (TIGR01671 family)
MEINLRIWDKEEKKFLNPCFELEEDRYNKGMAMIRWNSKGKLWATLSGYRDEDGNPFQLDAEFIQSTGIKDKNGVEIFEGDILSFYDISGVVKFGLHSDDVYNGWYVEVKATNTQCELNNSFSGAKIIGNIYENVELIA